MSLTIAEEDEHDLESIDEGDEDASQMSLHPQTEELNEQLLTGVKENDLNKIQESLKQGGDCSLRDEKNWTPLLWAGYLGNDQVVEILLQAGAGEEYKSVGIEVMEQSAATDETDAMASANGSRRQINSPLHWASYKGHIRCVWHLLNAQLSTTDVDNSGNNALHLAAAASHKDVVISLMYAGVDLFARNYNGNTALDLSTNESIRSILRKAMSQQKCPGTGREFGIHELRYRCHSSGLMYTEESSTSSQVPAYAESDVLMPVRFYTDSEYKVQDAEAALASIMQLDENTRRKLGLHKDLDHQASQDLSHPSEDDISEQNSKYLHEETSAYQAGPGPSDGAASGSASERQIPDTGEVIQNERVLEYNELGEDDVESLEKAIETAERLNASIKLIAFARQRQIRQKYWLELKKEMNDTSAARPLHYHGEAEALRTAIRNAAEHGVGSEALAAAQHIYDAALAEVRLDNIVGVCVRISNVTHSNDGDLNALSGAISNGEKVGADGDLLETAKQLCNKLFSELATRDFRQELSDSILKLQNEFEAFDEVDVTSFPKFEVSPEKTSPADVIETVQTLDELQAALPSDDILLDPLTSFRGDPAHDAWLAAEYMKEEKPVAGKKDTARGRTSSRGTSKGKERSKSRPTSSRSRSRRNKATKNEPPEINMPPSVPQLRLLRMSQRLLWKFQLALSLASVSGVDANFVEECTHRRDMIKDFIAFVRRQAIERIEASEIAAMKKRKKGKKGKGKKK